MQQRASQSIRNDVRFTAGQREHVLGPGRRRGVSPVAQIASILGHANLLCVMSGLRLGYKSTKRVCQAQLRLLGHLAQPDSADQHVLRVLVDEARGCLREVADASSQELHRLQDELWQLGEKTRSLVAEPPSDKRKRYTNHKE